jgi:hypothetical protein
MIWPIATPHFQRPNCPVNFKLLREHASGLCLFLLAVMLAVVDRRDRSRAITHQRCAAVCSDEFNDSQEARPSPRGNTVKALQKATSDRSAYRTGGKFDRRRRPITVTRPFVRQGSDQSLSRERQT